MSKNSDQPSVLTSDQLCDMHPELSDDAYKKRQVQKARPGTKIILPLVDPEDENAVVSYIASGNGYWHRSDTKAAAVARKTAERQVKNHG